MALGFDALSSAAISGETSGAAPPFANTDQPNPIARKQSGFLEVGQSLILATLAITVAVVFRAPLYTAPVKARTVALHDTVPNLLTGTLAPAIVLPFAQTDWPNPPARRAMAVETTPNVALYPPIVVLPFAQGDWPNPLGRRPISVDAAPNTLAAITVAPFNLDDWPNPQRARFQGIEGPPNVALNAPIPIPPFNQDEFPTPTRASSPGQLDAPGSLLLTTLRPAAPAPFTSLDWPTPQRAKGFASTDVQGANWIPPPSITAPFSQSDWPTPNRLRSAPSADSVAAQLPLGISPRLPVAALDWQNPPSRKPLRFDDAPNLLTAQLAPAAAILPPGSACFDLPPARPRQPRFDDPPNVALNAPLLATAPFAQNDQPLPPLRARLLPYADVGPNTTAAGIPPALLPFGLDDWTIPARARGISADPGSGSVLVLAAVPLPPFNQDEWLVPSRARSLPGIDPVPNLLTAQLALIGAVLPPGDACFDGAPARARQPRYDDPPNVAINSPVIPLAPFNQDEWVTPTRARATPYAETAVNWLCPPWVIAPFNQDEFPTPSRARFAPQAECSGIKISNIPPRVPVPAYDWQNPPRAKPMRFDDPPNLLLGTLAGLHALNPHLIATASMPPSIRVQASIVGVTNVTLQLTMPLAKVVLT
jgi:hypothetical protein